MTISNTIRALLTSDLLDVLDGLTSAQKRALWLEHPNNNIHLRNGAHVVKVLRSILAHDVAFALAAANRGARSDRRAVRRSVTKPGPQAPATAVSPSSSTPIVPVQTTAPQPTTATPANSIETPPVASTPILIGNSGVAAPPETHLNGRDALKAGIAPRFNPKARAAGTPIRVVPVLLPPDSTSLVEFPPLPERPANVENASPPAHPANARVASGPSHHGPLGRSGQRRSAVTSNRVVANSPSSSSNGGHSPSTPTDDVSGRRRGPLAKNDVLAQSGSM